MAGMKSLKKRRRIHVLIAATVALLIAVGLLGLNELRIVRMLRSGSGKAEPDRGVDIPF